MPTDATPSTAAAAPAAAGAMVFISYAHADEALRVGLRTHLSALEREGLVQAWDDREILGGDRWADEIDARLNQADVILLLVSADFIQSQYCYGKELARAMQRHDDPQDRAIVIPIILRPCDWEGTPFAHLQALPEGARPMPQWKTADDYYTAVTKGLRRRLQRLVPADAGLFERVRRRLRDPLWWQQPRVWAGSLGLLLALGAAAVAWQQAAERARQDTAIALQHLRSGRHQDAVAAVQATCLAWVRGQACFVLDKARLAARLDRPEDLPLEQFAAQVAALRTGAPDDPDLVFLDAQLALRESRADRQGPARADIARAITLAGGRFPEAHFYLANLALLERRWADALPLLDQALDPAVNPVAPAHYLNARAYARAQSGDLQGALADYEHSAERGSILSRIEMAELLWKLSAFDRASDQLGAALRALAAPSQPAGGRNALPWAFELRPGEVLLLKQPAEKLCFARWMHHAGLVLAGRPAPDQAAGGPDCGPEATRIAAAVGAALQRASGAGMDELGRERALAFVRQHRLM